LLIDLQEARGLALCGGDDLSTVGLRILKDPRGTSLGLRHNAIGIGLRLVLDALEVGTGRLHVAEGIDHLRRVVRFLQLYLLNQNAGVIGIERLLHQLLDLGLNRVPA